MKDHIEIGFIKKPKGLKGEVFVVLHGSDPSFLTEGETLVLEDKRHITINSIKPYKEGFLFTFEGVMDRNQSDLLKGKKLYISQALASSLNSEDEVFLATMIGYSFFNFDQKLGKVVGFSETKAHDLVVVELSSGDTVEVPWVSEFFKEVDHEAESIFFTAPKELLDPTFFEAGKKS
jgi:16S rRNA processing protein RimM